MGGGGGDFRCMNFCFFFFVTHLSAGIFSPLREVSFKIPIKG